MASEIDRTTRPALPGLRARWRDDKRGATLVQFLAVLPVFVIIGVGSWAMFQAYSAYQTLCEGVWESARYLQVEGPLLDPNFYPYPEGWEELATDIINVELLSNTAIEIGPIDESAVDITPDNTRPIRPDDQTEIREENIDNYWFHVHASAIITNPLAIFIEDNVEGGGFKLQCKRTVYYEEAPPLEPTLQRPGPGSVCPDPNIPCPPGPPPPTATMCPVGQSCPPTPCPICRP